MFHGVRGSSFLLLFVAALAVALLWAAVSHAAIPSPQELRQVVPGAESFSHELRPVEYYKMKDAAGGIVGAAFVTSSILPEIVGYRGEIDVLVGMDSNGTITGVKILGHRETADVFQKILDAGFVQRLVGRRAGPAFGEVEAVTGATISSQAIIDDVRTSAAAVANEIAAAGQPSEGGLGSWSRGPWLGAAAIAALLAMAVTASYRPRLRRLRTVVLVLSVAVVGLWLNSPMTIGDLVDLRNLVVPSFARMGLVLLMAFAIAMPFVRGNLYCAYLCPFGALQQGMAAVRFPKCCPSDRADRSAAWLRWVLSLAAVYGIAALGSESARTIEPFALCFSRTPVMPALVQTGAVLAAALFVRRIWCRFFCPTGLVLDILAQVGGKIRSLLRRRKRKDSHAAAVA